jgi:hypothetical protein
MREQGWSYRRIAAELQLLHNLNALLAFRLAHGWTQEEAARRWNERWSGDGPPKTGKNFSYWEIWPARGGRAPSAATLQRLAELYLCRPGDLLDGEDFSVFDTGSDVAVPALPDIAVPGQAVPGIVVPGQAVPGQAVPGQAVPGRPVPGVAVSPAANLEDAVVVVIDAGRRIVITREDARRAYRNLERCQVGLPAA